MEKGRYVLESFVESIIFILRSLKDMDEYADDAMVFYYNALKYLPSFLDRNDGFIYKLF